MQHKNINNEHYCHKNSIISDLVVVAVDIIVVKRSRTQKSYQKKRENENNKNNIRNYYAIRMKAKQMHPIPSWQPDNEFLCLVLLRLLTTRFLLTYTYMYDRCCNVSLTPGYFAISWQNQPHKISTFSKLNWTNICFYFHFLVAYKNYWIQFKIPPKTISTLKSMNSSNCCTALSFKQHTHTHTCHKETKTINTTKWNNNEE